MLCCAVLAVQLQDLLIRTSRPLAALTDKVVSNGVINLGQLVVGAMAAANNATAAAAVASRAG